MNPETGIGHERQEPPALRGLPYLGGKSAAAPQGAARWIASLLPYRTLYAEPFAGMLGILLTRQPSTLELVNDLDGNIFAWWTAVREHTGELARRLELSPVLSRQLYRESYQVLVDRTWEDQIDRAYRMAVVLCQGLNSKLGAAGATAPGYRVVYSKGRRALAPEYPSVERLYALARRLRRVQVERRDAVELLDRLAVEANSVVYVDPPYPSVQSYYAETVNFGDLTEVLKRQTGLVVVSGYGNEWDHLDWPVRLEYRSRLHLPNDGCQERVKVEVVWANQPLLEQGKLFDA